MSRCATGLVDRKRVFSFFFFFNDTAPTEIYTRSLHDALPISRMPECGSRAWTVARPPRKPVKGPARDRKSPRLNSSHVRRPYAVFCLNKKPKKLDVATSNPAKTTKSERGSIQRQI